MKIFVVGYMYCGKSTVGKQISKRLKYNFLDTDLMFEEKHQISISDYFSQFGEHAFRVAERHLLEELENYPNDVVISTGGGFPCFNDNMDLMKKMGCVVYLEASPNTIYQRFLKSNSPRPLLANLPKADVFQKIATQLSEREPFYSQANITLSAESVNLHALLQILTPLL